MAIPTSREEFKAYCLRKLGYPVIEINVEDDQVDDRIDEALKFYQDYHYDGSEKVYLDHTINANTIATKSITLDEDVIGVVGVFDMGWMGYSSGDPLLNIPYQIYVSDVAQLGFNDAVSNYVVMRYNLETMREVLVGKVPIRFNRHKDTLYIDIDKNKLQLGSHIIIIAYQKIDPTTYTDVWSDWWLQRYATQLIKRQWGDNMLKFEGIQLPGGVVLNASKIRDDAEQEIRELEEEVVNSFSIPAEDMIG